MRNWKTLQDDFMTAKLSEIKRTFEEMFQRFASCTLLCTKATPINHAQWQTGLFGGVLYKGGV